MMASNSSDCLTLMIKPSYKLAMPWVRFGHSLCQMLMSRQRLSLRPSPLCNSANVSSRLTIGCTNLDVVADYIMVGSACDAQPVGPSHSAPPATSPS